MKYKVRNKSKNITSYFKDFGEKMNFKEIIKQDKYNENKDLMRELAQAYLSMSSGVFITLNIEEDIEKGKVSELLSVDFNNNIASNEILLNHNTEYDPLVVMRDEYLELIDIGEIARLAYKNMIRGFADGIVEWNYKEKKLYGATFNTGTIENPENHVIEVYRLSQNDEFEHNCDVCEFDRKDNEECGIMQIEEDLSDKIDSEIREHLFSELPEEVFIDFVAEQLEIGFYPYE